MGEHKPVRVRAGTHQREPQQRRRAPGRSGGPARRGARRHASLASRAGQVGLGPRHGDGGRDDADRACPSARWWNEARRLRVPVEQSLAGGAQAGRVDRRRSARPRTDRVDVRSGRRRAGVWNSRPVCSGESGSTSRTSAPRPASSRRSASLSVTRDRLDGTASGAGARAGDRDEAGRGAVLEHLSRRDHQAGRTGPADQLHRHDAVAAEGEEVVVDADLGHAEHLGEHVAEQLLARGAGCPAGAAGGERRVRAGRPRSSLPLARHRQRVERDERARDHVVGQRGGDASAAQPVEARRRRTTYATMRLTPPSVAQHHGRLPDARRAGRRTASISPSSTRKPRIFTWWSARPRNSTPPSGASSAPGRRCGTSGRRARRTGRAGSARRSAPGRSR